jgi:hypothetical protein
MKFVSPALAAVLTLGLVPYAAEAQRTGSRGVTRTVLEGWSEALAIASREALPRIVIVPSVGGRVMFYGRDANVLWIDPNTAGRTALSADADINPGGFQCDIGPGVAGIPPHAGLWVGPYEWNARRNYLVTLEGAEDKRLGVELEKEIQFDPSTGDVGFVHRMKNTGERDSAFCLWHRIACRPGGFVILPLNRDSRFPAGWSQQRESGGRLTYDGTQPNSPGVRLLDGVLVARTGGTAAVIGADSNAQWVAYTVGRNLFVVHFPVYSSATYSEGGNTVTVAWDEQKTELQPLSPEARLRARKSYEFPLKWTLIDLPAEVTDHEQARRLVDQVPGSPFL